MTKETKMLNIITFFLFSFLIFCLALAEAIENHLPIELILLIVLAYGIFLFIFSIVMTFIVGTDEYLYPHR